MMWHGKVIGALLGALFTHSPWGIVIGILIGHYFDTQAMRGQMGATDPRQVQAEFFRATFQVMGHMAKADGHVSEEEIRAARAMMSELRLGEAEVRQAIELFTQGKARDFPLDDTLIRMRGLLRHRP